MPGIQVWQLAAGLGVGAFVALIFYAVVRRFGTRKGSGIETSKISPRATAMLALLIVVIAGALAVIALALYAPKPRDANERTEKLERQLGQAERNNLTRLNNLADLTIANDKRRDEIQRQALLLASAKNQTTEATSSPPLTAAEDAEIMKTFGKHPEALLAKVSEQRRIDAEETRALEFAISSEAKIRPRIQSALDAVIRALQRTSEREQLPLKSIETAPLPDRLILTDRELRRAQGNRLMAGVVNAQLTTEKRIRVQVIGGQIRTDASGPSLGEYPRLMIRAEIILGQADMVWNVGFDRNSGDLWTTDTAKPIGGDIQSGVFSHMVAKLAEYRVELAAAQEKPSP